MFTGIITDLGEVKEITEGGIARFVIQTSYDMESVDMGASIACSGACLTVVDKGAGWFAADVSEETLDKTTMGSWTAGTKINLERALRVGDELGGHIVSGHVDGVGQIVSITEEGDSLRYVFSAPESLAKYIASKGSITIDGVSLTVNEVDGCEFGVNIIPHTQSVTTFGSLIAGDRVNLEIDMLARYVARLFDKD